MFVGGGKCLCGIAFLANVLALAFGVAFASAPRSRFVELRPQFFDIALDMLHSRESCLALRTRLQQSGNLFPEDLRDIISTELASLGREWDDGCRHGQRGEPFKLGLRLLAVLLAARLSPVQNRQVLDIFRSHALQFSSQLRQRSAATWESERQLRPPSAELEEAGVIEDDAGEESKVRDDDTWRDEVHIAMVASIGHPPFGHKALGTIRSALFFARRRVHFHLFVDAAGAEDMRRAVGRLEPWLRARGRFSIYGPASQRRAWESIRRLVPRDCLTFSPHYGGAGFLRLVAHEVVTSRRVNPLLFVDAGDYVFQSDPSELLKFHQYFNPWTFAAAPISHPLPFQLFDLRAMRLHNWTNNFLAPAVQEGYARDGPALCELGEGWTLNILRNRFRDLWLDLPCDWAAEPWYEFMAGHGVLDLWSNDARNEGREDVWRLREPAGIEDYMTLRVHCPGFLEIYGNLVAQSFDYDIPTRDGIKKNFLLASAEEARESAKLGITSQTYVDSKGQLLTCGERIKGIHFVSPFHHVPWAHRYLNFWAGADVWHPKSEEGRDLRIGVPV